MSKIKLIHIVACGILLKIVWGIHLLIPASMFLQSPACSEHTLIAILFISILQAIILFKSKITKELHSILYASLFIWLYLACILVLHGYPMFMIIVYFFVVVCDLIATVDFYLIFKGENND